MDIKDVILTLHPLERKVLPVLSKFSILGDIAKETKLKEVEVMRALQWLQNKKIIELKEEIKELVVLDENGRKYLKTRLPETRLLKIIENAEKDSLFIKTNAHLSDEEFNVCVGVLKRKAAIEISKENGKLKVKITPNGKKLLEKHPEEDFLKKDFPLETSSLMDLDKLAYDNLKKRKEIIKIEVQKIKSAQLTDLGKKVAKSKIKEGGVIDRLTPEMLKTGKWKGKSFRAYDIQINVPKVFGGKRHFVNQAIEYIRKIWLEMGFEEMSGNIVQTSFWDLDALFVPQDHPARAMQDTFYLKNPKYGKLPQQLVKKIKPVHENGGNTGSLGWQSPWSEEIAKENLLRTHTTVLSAQAIAKLKKGDLPKKYFSVGKVFRNEAVDWKHLFELTQIDGIVVDPDVNFRHLIGYLKEFFKKMGYLDVRVRPAHFPYTEPSAEIEALHPIKKEWVELGGSGIFRPEVTKPLIGTEVPVLAWGLGMERIISEYFNISDIRDLYKNNLKQIREMKAWMR